MMTPSASTGMTQLSAELTNESKRYASRAQDLYRQVRCGRLLPALTPDKLKSLVMQDETHNITKVMRSMCLQALLRKYTPIAVICGLVVFFIYIRYAFYR